MREGGRDESQGVRVLVVAADSRSRERLGDWLTEDGHEVIECPGPCAPDYTCLGGRGEPCPLAKAADVVVLDMLLASDSVIAGTPSWRLLDYYLERGHPVVAISGPDEASRFYPDERVISLSRPADRNELLGAVDFLGERRHSVVDIGALRLTPRRKLHRPYRDDRVRTILAMANRRKEE